MMRVGRKGTREVGEEEKRQGKEPVLVRMKIIYGVRGKRK